MFRNKIEISSGKDENTSPHFWCFETKLKQALEKVKIPGPIFGVLKQWDYIGKIIETDWNMKKIDEIRNF